MAKKPMMGDPDTPDNQEAENIMSSNDLRSCVVRIEYVGPKSHRPTRIPFPSRAAANEFMNSVNPAAFNTGSMKQNRLKRAELLRCAPEVLDDYEITVSIEEPATDARPTAAGRTVQSRSPSTARSGATDRKPVQDRPTRSNAGKLIGLGAALSPDEAELREEGDGEADDSGDESGSET